MIKNIVLLGSTGSIGRSTLDVIREDGHRLVAMSFFGNYKLGLEQYYEFRPEVIGVEDEYAYEKLKEALKDEPVSILGRGSSEKIAESVDYDVLVLAIVGIAALKPAYAAAKSAKRVAIANKEALVVFGEALKERCRSYGTELIPVDSEHSAIFQCLNGEDRAGVSKIVLTCSGGPFRELSSEEIALKSAEEAIKHPKWNMGKKISIDSATLMNKGLEFIEAMRLFDVSPSDIEIVIHPESTLHSAVLFKDGSMMAELSEPDMRIAIRYAISYPNRNDKKSKQLSGGLNFLFDNALHFYKPDYDKFPCLSLAISAAEKGGVYPLVLNSANEACCKLYLEHKIGFYDISLIISDMLNKSYSADIKDVDDVLFCHDEVYNKVMEIYG